MLVDLKREEELKQDRRVAQIVTANKEEMLWQLRLSTAESQVQACSITVLNAEAAITKSDDEGKSLLQEFEKIFDQISSDAAKSRIVRPVRPPSASDPSIRKVDEERSPRS